MAAKVLGAVKKRSSAHNVLSLALLQYVKMSEPRHEKTCTCEHMESVHIIYIDGRSNSLVRLHLLYNILCRCYLGNDNEILLERVLRDWSKLSGRGTMPDNLNAHA